MESESVAILKSPLQLLAFMRAQFTFFHQGYELLHEYDPFMRQVASEVDKLRKSADVVSHDMESRHTLVTPKHIPVGGAWLIITVYVVNVPYYPSGWLPR